MSSFFTVPASQKKRKRADAASAASKRRNVAPTTTQLTKRPRQREREESISGSESSDGEPAHAIEEEEESGSSGDENETAADRRRRLAERYLENIKSEVQDDVGFDAAEIDRDLIAERLKEDVAETKGKVYRRIAENLDLAGASHTFGRSGPHRATPTGCAVHLPYAWIISKEMFVEKWELADPNTWRNPDPNRPTNITPRTKPRRLFWRRGNSKRAHDRDYLGHTGAILSIAVSDSGKFLATGDETGRLVIWDADTLTPKKLFTQHRDAITSLSFRRGTEQLFSASADRTIKIWSASELAYIETLFGHQDTILGVAGGLEINQETCVSVGARDRTARLWKVVEESQLVFRGGGTARQKGMEKLKKGRFGGSTAEEEKVTTDHTNGMAPDDEDPPIAYAEGSIDCVAFLDASLFVTGSDNGALCLWSVHKKKPLFTVPLAHGRDPPIPPEEMSTDGNVTAPRLPRYITAVATVPYADLILTGSWDGVIRAWRLGPEKRSIEPLGDVGRLAAEEHAGMVNGDSTAKVSDRRAGPVPGIVNGLTVCERGNRGKDGVCIVAAVAEVPRLGRWMRKDVHNGIAVLEVPRKITHGVDESEDEEDAS
ncbi:WD40 repeat-like protein [Westerdykella ornata]|uniref:WD40 repeat-like protein n=1 Tax=Westerdykella ornata TaxID=318751 RepID=A0A6A6JW26_WESOR|nr:WD40 repeat-like protein [Westerdykella ornata]KAF2280811.1 WD40 repeat-like protein [Westerdykella ornata]